MLEAWSGARLRGSVAGGGAKRGAIWTLALMMTIALAASSAAADTESQAAPKKHAAASRPTVSKAGKAKTRTHAAAGRVRRKHRPRKPLSRKALARSHKLKQAFVASSQLRP